MTYKGIFEKCKTVGECRRVFCTLVDELDEDFVGTIARHEIEEAYTERRKEILDKAGAKL